MKNFSPRTKLLKTVVTILAACPVIMNAADAAPLETYEFVGQPGNETMVSPLTIAKGLSGLSFTESVALSPSAAADSISATGFNNAGAYYQFGFGVQSGFSAVANQLTLSTRSSGTGPGFLNLLASVDGGSFSTIGTFAQNGTAFNSETLNFMPLMAISSLMFRITPASQVSASGGVTAGTGTFRVADFNATATPTPFTVSGTVNSIEAVPETASWMMMIAGMGAVGFAMRRHRRVRTPTHA